jgi:ArsR family transcriptional regulator
LTLAAMPATVLLSLNRDKEISVELSDSSAFLRALSDPTRLRLLALLEREELTVAELSAVTRLAQPRVSTHLAKLKEIDLVRDRRAGVSAYYRLNADGEPAALPLWRALRDVTDDALIDDDAKRLAIVLARRAAGRNWADAVAGDMERHYSPGRTWEAMARSFGLLLDLGDVLDIASGDGVISELLAPQARSITCIDAGARVVEAASARLAAHRNVQVRVGDMHALDVADASFDLVLLMHALPYSERPARVLREAARVLRPGGRVVACTLARHQHRSAVAEFDHKNLGFTVPELDQLARGAGLTVQHCGIATRERRPPHFEVLSLLATKPSGTPA